MSTRILSQEEKEQRIAAGAAVRQARMEKRSRLALENIKKGVLKEESSVADHYHIGLKKRVSEAAHHLYCVVYRGESLNLELIPQIVDLFEFSDSLDARVAYKLCREEYERLISRCWYFQRGVPATLIKAAFAFWDKILSFPEVNVNGVLILNIFASGQINEYIFKILEKYRDKFIEAGMAGVIVNDCTRMLREGHAINILTGTIKVWSENQREILNNIIRLFDGTDLRSLEEIAEDKAEE